MSHLLGRNIEFLEKLNNASPDEAKLFLEQATEDNILALTELALNILKGKLNISLDTYLQLKDHSDLLRKISKKSVSVKNKRKWLMRSLEILPCLISPLLSCLGSSLVRWLIEENFANG